MGTIDFSKYGIQKPATSTKPKVDFAKYGVSKASPDKPFNVPETQQAKQQRYQAEADIANQAATKANSFTEKYLRPVSDTILPGVASLGDTIGGILSSKKITDGHNQADQAMKDVQFNLAKKIREVEASGGDATKWKQSYNEVQQNINRAQAGYSEATAGARKSTGQVSGELALTALNVLGAGSYGKSTTGMKTGALTMPFTKTSAVPTAVQNARGVLPTGLFSWNGVKNISTSVAKGLPVGYSFDVANGLAGNRGTDRTGFSSLIPGAGTVTAGALSGVTPFLSESLQTGKNVLTTKGHEAVKTAAFNDKLNKALPVLKKDVKTLPVKQTDARTALGDIVANKDKVGIIDPATGEAKLPSQYNFNETAQAQATRMKQIYADYSNQLKGVDKTKFDGEIHTSIFKQIDGLSKDLNVENSIDGRRALTKIRAELSSLRDTSPMGIQNYIESIGQRTRTAPGHPPTVEQIKLANVAGAMRKSLDEAVGKVDGPGYQELRNTYKAHKTIESQVLQAAKSELNKTPGWTDRLANIGMTAEGIQFMLTHDPQALAVAAGIKGTAKFMKWQRSPQRALSGMFKQLEQAQSSKPLTPSYMNQPASSVPNMTNIDASLPQSAKTSSLPSGNKMADYRNGVPNSEGGYTINPLARKQTKPVSVSLSNSISEPMKRSVAKELENYDTTPLTVNGKPHFGNVEVEHRLAELKAKNARGTFTNADAIEAKALLKKVGIDLDKPVKKYGAK